ncbi:MAG TPA: LuxR C-terminal-related transcriptional regulator [Chitinophagaceae bacterium]|nr:LuxR C-terminal-related transcriptional regulator [Chitinophagaceae bacterium]
MEKTIYILHQRSSLADLLAWTLRLGTDLNVTCLGGPQELKQAETLPDLILVQPELYEKIHAFMNGSMPPILLIASHPDDEQVIDALYAGAADVVDLGKGPEELLEKTNQILNNAADNNALIRKLIHKNKTARQDEKDETEYGLTMKEKEVLKMMREGSHLKLIAQLTNSSYETVRTHVKHIYKKLGVMSASEAVIKAMKMEL